MKLVKKLYKKFTKWFTGKDQLTKEQVQEAISDLVPQPGAPRTGPQIRTLEDIRVAQEIRTLRDLKIYSDDVRKTLGIMKRTAQKRLDNDAVLKKGIDSLYVEVGNMKNQISALASRTKRNKAAPPEKPSKEA